MRRPWFAPMCAWLVTAPRFRDFLKALETGRRAQDFAPVEQRAPEYGFRPGNLLQTYQRNAPN
ncbi:MAG TPA: hypothetical protein VK841_22385 [Polyangiaceae bacterium]|nr:hypothetical protein [Polyangiaceae bacterium]